jgi:DNA topoisomerase-1
MARAAEHKAAAVLAGLVYVTDGLPGISRKKAGKGWAFYGKAGKRIADVKERKRILSLVIPPAWTDVWVCPNPKGHIQVTARDVKGRKQYRYHPDYRSARDTSKFKRIFELSEVLPSIGSKQRTILKLRS